MYQWPESLIQFQKIIPEEFFENKVKAKITKKTKAIWISWAYLTSRNALTAILRSKYDEEFADPFNMLNLSAFIMSEWKRYLSYCVISMQEG